MEQQTDKAFIKNVTIVLVILVVFTFSIIFLAKKVGFLEETDDNPSRNLIAAERIKPVADVYTGEEGAAAIEEAVAETAPAQAAAFDGSLDTEMLYNTVCAACHATGAAGAPLPGSEQMSQRAEKGMEAMMQSALNGLNAMPARGGRPDLSDEEIKAAVEFMLQ